MQVEGPVRLAIEKLKAEPGVYRSIFYQYDMPEWPEDQQHYTMVLRDKSRDMILSSDDSGYWYHIRASCLALDANVQCNDDAVTDSLLASGYEGYALPSTLRPGRGMGQCMDTCLTHKRPSLHCQSDLCVSGVADVPWIKLVRPVGQEPSDVNQGSVGNW